MINERLNEFAPLRGTRFFATTKLGVSRAIFISKEEEEHLNIQQFKQRVCEEDDLSWLDDVGSDPNRLRIWLKDPKACCGRTKLQDSQLLKEFGPGDHYMIVDRGDWFRESYAGYLLSAKPAKVRLLFYLAMVCIGYGLLFAGAQAKFYIWADQTVPFTFQTLAVLVVPAMLGGPGFISVFCYVLSGAFGAPVFADMKSGIEGLYIGYFIGFCMCALLLSIFVHTGFARTILSLAVCMCTGIVVILGAGWIGYFIGFCMCALLLSIFVHTGFARTILSLAVCMCTGIVVILGAGWIGYAYYSDWNWVYSFEQAVAPFLISEVIKLLLATGILILAWRVLVLFANRNRFGFNWRSLFTGLY